MSLAESPKPLQTTTDWGPRIQMPGLWGTLKPPHSTHGHGAHEPPCGRLYIGSKLDQE